MVRRVVAATLLCALSAATSASAGEPTDTLRRLFDQANRILLSDATDDTRLSALRALVRTAFDAGEAAALALGREWQARTPAERDEFSRLFGDVIEGAYLGGVGSRARVHADGIRVAFESESVQGARATVRTTLETRAGGHVPVEYRMTLRDSGWAVVDVIVEGLSLADSYRAQFDRVMRSGNYAQVVARLREKASATTLAAIAAAKAAAAAVMPSAAPAPRPAPVVAPRPEPPVSPVVVSGPEPASEPPALAPPGPSPRKSFWVQVGAFRSPDAASRLVERLREHSVTVATGGQHVEPLARVLVGPFADRAAAASSLKDLVGRGYRAFIAFE